MCAEIMDLEDLGASGRLLAIRKLKKNLYQLQIGFTLLFSILLLVMHRHTQLVPLHIPLSNPLFLILVMGLVFTIESSVFRYLEIRFSRNPTSRYYMVDRSRRRSLIGLAIVLVMLAVSFAPGLVESMEGSFSVSGHLDDSVFFYNRDSLGLNSVEYIEFRSTTTAASSIYLVTEESYQLAGNDYTRLRELKLNALDEVDGHLRMEMPDIGRKTLYLVVEGDGLDYEVQKSFSPLLKTTVPIVVSGYLVALLGWIVYLIVMRSRLAREAIYR